MASPLARCIEPVKTAATVATRRQPRDIRNAEEVVLCTYGTAVEMSGSSRRRYHPDRHRAGPETVMLRRLNVIILLPLLRRLSARTRLVVGLALITVGLFLIITALAHGVIAVIVGAIFLASVCREQRRFGLGRAGALRGR
jgi:hypothetical protein